MLLILYDFFSLSSPSLFCCFFPLPVRLMLLSSETVVFVASTTMLRLSIEKSFILCVALFKSSLLLLLFLLLRFCPCDSISVLLDLLVLVLVWTEINWRFFEMNGGKQIMIKSENGQTTKFPMQSNWPQDAFLRSTYKTHAVVKEGNNGEKKRGDRMKWDWSKRHAITPFYRIHTVFTLLMVIGCLNAVHIMHLIPGRCYGRVICFLNWFSRSKCHSQQQITIS